MKIISMYKIDSVQGTDSRPYHAIDITFDNGHTIQVERPLTISKLKATHSNKYPIHTFDNIKNGDII